MKYVQPYGVEDDDAPYVNGNPVTGVAGSIPPAAAFEHPQRELIAAIEKSGLAPSGEDLTQLARAVRSQRLNYFLAGGTANAITVSGDPAISAYTPGLILRVKIAANNTGPATINAGAGAAAIKRKDGSALAADDLVAGQVADLVFDGTNFQVVNFAGPPGTGGGATNIYNTYLPYAAGTGTGDAIVAAFSPAIASRAAGDAILVKAPAANTGAVTIAVDGLAVAPVKRLDGAALQAGDIAAGEILWLAFDGVNYQVLNFVASLVAASITSTWAVTVENPYGVGSVFVTGAPVVIDWAVARSGSTYFATYSVLSPTLGVEGHDPAGLLGSKATKIKGCTQAQSIAGYDAYMATLTANFPYAASWLQAHVMGPVVGVPTKLPGPGTWVAVSEPLSPPFLGVVLPSVEPYENAVQTLGLHTFIRVA